MAKRLRRVELTESFLERLDSIETFLLEADAYEDVLAGLRNTVVPNIACFPLMGGRYLDQPPQSVEDLEQFAKFPAGAADGLRVLMHGDYLIPYSVHEEVGHLI